MTIADLLVIVPARSRPASVAEVVKAWEDTDAFEVAELLFAIDYDDPQRDAYLDAIMRLDRPRIAASIRPRWEPMVHKLDRMARADIEVNPSRFALGFAGDDHRPRTYGWAARYLEMLRQARTGIAYCADGYQDERLPTQWVMTTDIVRALGRMVPAPVAHLFCDNAVRDLGTMAGVLHYEPGMLIEHMHPAAGKASSDEQYDRVNGSPQWKADRRAYRSWKASDLPRQAGQVQSLLTSGRDHV